MTYKKTNEALRDEHATIGGIHGKKTFIFDNAGNQITNFGGAASATVSIGSSATIFAVVNTAAAGQASIVLDEGVKYIGLATVDIGTNNAVALRGNVTISDSKGFIGLTTVVQASSARTITGNLTLSDPKGFIGLTTTVIGSAPTIFAVVNTSAAGQASVVLDTGANYIGLATIDIGTSNGVAIKGNVTLSDSKGFIGLTTVVQSSIARTITGNLTLSDSKGFIGLTTTVLGSAPTIFAVVNTGAPGQASVVLDTGVNYVGLVTVDIGTNNSVAIKGNVTLSDPKGFIGLTTVVQSSTVRSLVGNITLSDSKTYIGLVTATNASAWPDPKTYIGLVTVANTVTSTIVGNITLSDPKTFIGLTTTTLGASPAFVGIVTVTNRDMTITGNVTLSDAKTFIGLVTAVTRNAGTLKTLVSLPIGLGNNSLATVAVPTNANKINITSFILNSNITTEIALKSGVTYLTGNASLGVTLFPGGGFVLPGAPDSPSWIGLPSGALVVEKRDPGGTVSKVGGGVIYFDE